MKRRRWQYSLEQAMSQPADQGSMQFGEHRLRGEELNEIILSSSCRGTMLVLASIPSMFSVLARQKRGLPSKLEPT